MARVMRLFLLLCAVVLATHGARASEDNDDFHLWLESVRVDALREGISEATLHDALDHTEIDDRVVKLDKKQPEKTITFDDYAAGIVSAARIKEARRVREQNETDLDRAAKQYGVPVQIIVALWGIESNFGKHTGNFSVIDSLVTLAYEGRRAMFFRKELIEALHVLDEEHIAASDLRGSWAGAMGQCQFMPSTYRHYAADENNDGKRDIWKNDDDVFGSIANYLTAEGWGKSIGWGNEVTLEKDIPDEELGLEVTHSLDEWRAMGVKVLGDVADEGGTPASLIQPDGPGGRSFLVYDNFRALMKWNRSTYFATSVGLFADRIK